MANYSPQHFEPRAKTANVKGVANRAVATVLTAGLIAQPLMSPLAAIAAPSTDNGDSVQGGGSSVENTVAAGNQAVVKTAAQLAEESAKQLKDAQAAYDAAQKKADAAGQSQKQAQQQKNQASQAVTDNAAEQNEAEVAALQEKIDELKAAVEKTEQQQKKLGDLNDQLEQANKSVEDKTQALKDAKAKQDEAKKALDDAQAKLEAMGMDEYEAAKKAVEDARAKLDDANKAVTTAQDNLDQAKAAEASAQQEKQNTEAALTTAQAKKQETAAALAAATTARDNAQQKFNQAQAALDAAVSGTGVDLSALEAAKKAAAGELKTAQAELNAATDADATAQTNLQAAQAAVAAAQEKANAANAAVASAQSAYDAANKEYKDAASKRDAAKTAYEQAQQTEADKKTAYDKLVEVRKQKRSEWEAACAASNAAEKAYDAANVQVEALEQQIADLKSNMTVDQEVINKGMLGFMAYISNSSDFTAMQKSNAKDAMATLTGADDKAEWYDDYVDQDMSRDTNPLSLEQLRNALTYLDTQNNLRKANGQSALSVSLRMTAAAALNASYSSNIWDHSNCYFDNAENLAGGGGAYTGGETEDTLGWPYTGLYTQEKVNYENWIKKYGVDSEAGKDLMAHRYDSYYIYQNYYDVYHGTKDKNGNQRGDACGHYLNIIDSATVAIGIATGSGKNTDSEVTIFDYSADDTQADFTVSEFKKLVNDYIDSAYNAGGTQAQKAQLKELQGKLAEAQKNFGTTREAYFAAVNGQDAAQDAFTAADVNMNTAKGEYEKAQSATAAAKSAYTAAEAKLKGIDVKTPKTKLNAAKGEAATA